MPTTVLDIEQHLLLLELEAPFDKRDVQLARRRMAKRWHPDVAPAGPPVRARAPPEGDQRGRRPARAPGRGLARRAGLAQRRQSQRRGGAPRARGGRPARLRGRAARARPRQGTRQARPLRQPRARPLGRAPLRALRLLPGVGRGHRRRDLLLIATDRRGRRRGASSGRASSSATASARCRPGSMQFVDFSKPDPAEERVERFMIAAQRAMAEGEYELAAQRLIYARDAEPRNVAVLRLMTLAFWQAGKLEEAARAVRDWARVDGRPARPPTASRRASTKTWARSTWPRRPPSGPPSAGPTDAGAWERLGRLRLRLLRPRGSAQGAARARSALGARRGRARADRAGARARADARRA